MGTTSHTHDNGSSPAHTGNTDAWQLAGFSTWAHPRAYGENNAYALRTGLIQGSSPRIRGKRNRKPTRPRTHGLIPAHTGNAQTGQCEQRCGRAHPRAYGECPPTTTSIMIRLGSSPRIRGMLISVWVVRFPAGLIPAHTGNAIFGTEPWAGLWAHPRAYGECLAPSTPELERRGSSPRIRGMLESPAWVERSTRLIPAHTGNAST